MRLLLTYLPPTIYYLWGAYEATLRNSEISNLAKEKFPEVTTGDFYYCESDGSILEEDIIMDYIFQKRNDNLTLYIRKHHDEHLGNFSNLLK